MADIALCVASEVAKYLVPPVGRHCGYVIFSDRYVRQLNDEVKNLGDTKDEVQRSINEAQNQLKPIKAKVDTWVEKVEASTNKARNMLENYGRAEKTCFYGWLPNPKARYGLGKEASEMVKEIKHLIEQGQFERVYEENPPPGLVHRAPDMNPSASDGDDTIPDSQASIFQGIMKALDDEKNKVIGVYGPGGVGKTRLLEIVEKKLREEGRPFHMIVKAKVSQTPDLKKIQYDIAYDLGLNNLKDEPSEKGRRDLLFKRLQKDPSEKVLIILDDLWAELDLNVVGIPSGDVSGKCKLLLTSRFKDVLGEKMRADRTFLLQGLNDVEALRLFEKTIGDRLKDDMELKSIAPRVVEKLVGLPLLIISVASTLRDSDASAWRNALIEIDESNIETIVMLSYNHLKSEDTKSLFLLCGLIGGTIQVETLLFLGMGLGLFEKFRRTVQDSRDRLNNMLNKLHSVCLLLDGGDDKDNVTIHDLYSEVVVSNAFSGQHSLMINSNYASWPKEKLEKCWACLANAGNDRLAELMPFPHVKILMLSKQYFLGDCSRMDFTHMKELRPLCLCSMYITSLPSSMEILGNLQSLSIDCDVEDVAILGKLKALRILSFAGSGISRLPKEIGELTNLQSLNLSNCYSLELIEPGALKGLINLEELHMMGCFDTWMGKHEIPSESFGVGLAELKSLTKLTSLEISIPSPIILLEDGNLPFGNLVRFWINTVNTKARKFKVLRTMELKLEGCDNILSIEWVQKALKKTQYLNLCQLCKLSEFKKSAHGLCTQGFRELKHLDIYKSPSIKYIANSSDGLPLVAFVKLESLFLKNLVNLEKIYHGPIAPQCFSKLKAVSVGQCNRLKYLWCLSDMHRFVQLEEIEVWNCDSMQSIVTHDAGKDIVSADNRVALPKVRRLVLRQLPNMTSFCARAEITSEDTPIQVSFPSLESLVMVGLLDLEKILFGQPPLEYNNLKSIEIRESRSKSSFFKSDWILKLPNLESLVIWSSPSVEAIFDLGELKVMRGVEILSRLMKLTIAESPNLRCMWKQDVKLQGISVFRSLKKLMVQNTELAFLFPVSMAKSLRELRDIEVKHCPNMKAVIVDEEGRDEGTNDIIEFPLLERLYISDCPTNKFFSYLHGKKESIATSLDSQDAYSDSFFDPKVSLPSLEMLSFYKVGSFKWIWRGEVPRSSFCKLATLFLGYCSNLSNVFPSTIKARLHNLKSVEVQNCPSLESLFDCGSLDANTEQTSVLLPKLEDVREREAGKMRCMVMSDSQMNLDFPSLKAVEVDNCSDMKATKLEKLERIDIRQCEQMKEVVLKEEGGRSKADVMTFPSLRHLSILQCPNFGAFIRSPTDVERQLDETAEGNDESLQPLFNEMVTFPNIRKLEIEGVQCKELWNDQIPTNAFQKLESLKLKHCNNLLHIAPSHMWKRLQCCLEILEVVSCHSIEIKFESDGNVKKSGKLRRLVLRDLHNLRHIWQYSGLPNGGEIRDIEVVYCPNMKAVIVDEEGRDEGTNDIIEFPLLERLYISGCPTNKFFSYPHGKKESITTTSYSQDAYSDSFFDPMVCLPSLEMLSFYKVGSFKRIWHCELPKSSFCKLATLSLSHCFELLNVFPSTIKGRLHNLQNVNIANCPSLESLFDCGSPDANIEQTTVLLLPKLEEVCVTEAGKMRCMVKSDSQMIWGFPSLKVVSVTNCSDMKYLFPNFTATTLEKLERIDIRQCEQLKEVVPEEEGGRSKADVMSFRSLRHLRILQCPNFGVFIRSPTSVKRQLDETAEENNESPRPLFNEMVTFPNIISLKIEGLQCKELWNNQIPTDSFLKLKSLELKNCDNLQHIAPSHMWKRLQHCLEILEVISCRSIEIIYEGDGTDTGSGKLRMLVLHDLENLRHIWQSNGLPNIPFPNLRYVEAVRCSRLEMLFATFTAEFLGQIEELVVESCGHMELIAGHEIWEEATGTTITFSELTALRLFELPKFRSFLPEKYSLKSPYSEKDFPSLRDLSIVSCGAEPDQGTVDWESGQALRGQIWLFERLIRWDR